MKMGGLILVLLLSFTMTAKADSTRTTIAPLIQPENHYYTEQNLYGLNIAICHDTKTEVIEGNGVVAGDCSIENEIYKTYPMLGVRMNTVLVHGIQITYPFPFSITIGQNKVTISIVANN